MPRARDPNQSAAISPRAARLRFTGRAAETRRFLDLLSAGPGEPAPLLMFYGVGGAGKSRLLDHLQQRCDARGAPWAAVDLTEARDADQALPALAAQLEARHGLRFDGFKRVLAVLVARQKGQSVTPRMQEYMAATGGETAGRATDLVLDGLGLVPVVGQLAAVVKLAKGASGVAFKQAMGQRGFRDAMLRLGGEGEIVDLIEWSTEQLTAELQRRFAADLVNGLTGRIDQAGAPPRAALFFDTHEALWQDTKGGAATQDAWLRLLREYLHERPVVMVVAGRDRLRWPADWDETDAAGRALWLEQRLLAGLAPDEARDLLRRTVAGGEAERAAALPAALEDAILRVTDERSGDAGSSRHHCLLLTLCAEVVVNTLAQTGAYPEPAVFDAIPHGDAAAEPIVRRFLLSLRNEAMVNWLEELSLTPRFDEEFALALDAARRHGNARAGWERLQELSLLNHRDDGFLEPHRLLRAALQQRIAPPRALAVHRWAAAYWSDHAGGDWEARGLAWYHRRALDHAAALAEYRDLLDAAERAGDQETVRALTAWWQDVPVPEPAATIDQALDAEALADGVRRLTTGDPNANLRRAVALYDAALAVVGEQSDPERWALIQRGRANALLMLQTGDREANLGAVIAGFEAALRVFDEATHPREWARTRRHLGNVYSLPPAGDVAQHLARAIEHYQAALRVFTESEYPEEWARTRNNLGKAYGDLPGGDRAANLTAAIACYEAALRVFTRERYPYFWALTRLNLGSTRWRLPAGDRAARTAQAVAAFEDALSVLTETEYPFDWALAQHNLGLAYSSAPGGGGAAVARAISCYEAALRVRTELAAPFDWAATTAALGTAYWSLGDGDRAANLRRAIACYEAALRVQSERDAPAAWAGIQNNLALAYCELPDGDPATNFATAVTHFEAALRVRTEAAYPYEWATVQYNLGCAYAVLARTDPALAAKAAACFEAALRVHTRETHPYDWATLHVQLSAAVRRAAVPDRTAAARAALAHTEAALTVLTEAEHPADWAEARFEMAGALRDLGDDAAARAALADAGRGYRAAGEHERAAAVEAASADPTTVI